MKKIAVVILNWNGKSLLEKFLPPLLAHTSQDIADIIVADNASSDDSVDFMKLSYPAIQLILLYKKY
jgi:GT2 family glycosyltransferase